MFVPAIFLSAFLLFLVQSIAGKHLLPWFGGAPATWAACMLFFQLLLLAGYAHAWALDRLARPRTQRIVQAALAWLASALMVWQWREWQGPLLAAASLKPDGLEPPVAHILKTLGLAVGLPFFVLSAHGPLLQRWRAQEDSTAPVYRLFAASNGGSLLGLLAFPFVLEPRWPLGTLAMWWAGGFMVLAAWLTWRAAQRDPAPATPAPAPAAAMPSTPPERLTWGRRLLWVLLAAVPSALFLATTNQLCLEVAVVPLLWVLPLALYLVAFILCFASGRWYRRNVIPPLAAVATLVVLISAWMTMYLSIPVQIATHAGFLLLMCVTLLGELALRKPGIAHLTEFYLWIAVGGALGGLAVSLGAPALLMTVSEFHALTLVAWAAVGLAWRADRTSPFFAGGRGHALFLLWLAAASLVRWGAVSLRSRGAGPPWLDGWLLPVAAATAAIAATAWLAGHPRWLLHRGWAAAMVIVLVLIAELFWLDRVRATRDGLVAQGRNFFGHVMVQDVPQRGVATRQLVHGRINHGFQYLDEALRRQPAGYSHPDSGVGLAILQHPRRATEATPLRVGVAGLGAGTLAAYVRPQDTMRFYEINPLVIEYAAGPGALFTCIREAPGTIETVPGDARLSLEREWSTGGSQNFDVLVLDAFSSDSVPVHLLTIEAMELYLKNLRDENSLIVANISNRFLDFRPLMNGLAAHFGLDLGISFHTGNPPVPVGSIYAVFCRPGHRPTFWDRLTGVSGLPPPGLPLVWTDQHSDLFRLIRAPAPIVRRAVVQSAPAGAPPTAPLAPHPTEPSVRD